MNIFSNATRRECISQGSTTERSIVRALTCACSSSKKIRELLHITNRILRLLAISSHRLRDSFWLLGAKGRGNRNFTEKGRRALVMCRRSRVDGRRLYDRYVIHALTHARTSRYAGVLARGLERT
jgi:hypothetical protein